MTKRLLLIIAVLAGFAFAPQRFFHRAHKTYNAPGSSLLTVSNLSCAGIYRIPAIAGNNVVESSYPTTFRRIGGSRKMLVYGGDGHVYDFDEPTYSSCNTSPASANSATLGTNYGYFTVNDSQGFLPGCPYAGNPNCSSFAAGMFWDEVKQWLILNWTATYSSPPASENSFAAATYTTGSANSLSTVGCWGLQNIQQPTSGQGTLRVPSSFLSTYSANLPASAAWAVGLTTIGEWAAPLAGSIGPVMFMLAPPATNPCSVSTDTAISSLNYATAVRYQANTTGPTCSTPGCTPANAPNTPYSATSNFTGYSDSEATTSWDPYAGVGYINKEVDALTWYDDGVKQGILNFRTATDGWVNSTIQASPSPTAITTVAGSGSVRIADGGTHDGSHILAGDVVWVQSCDPALDGAGCSSANGVWDCICVVDSVSGTAPMDLTFHASSFDSGNGTTNHTPVVGTNLIFGGVYTHGTPMHSRDMYRLQIYDPADLGRVLTGAITDPSTVAYKTETEIDNTLITMFGCPTCVSPGVHSNTYAHEIFAAMADTTAQQILVVVRHPNTVSYDALVVVFNVSHTP